MDFWMSIIEGCGIFLIIWVSRWLINEDRTHQLFWLSQPLFIIGLVLVWFIPIDWSIHDWIKLLVSFALNLIDNVYNHVRLDKYLKEDIKHQAWWKVGPLRQYRIKDGYVQDASTGAMDNAFTSRFGTTVLGTSSKSSLWNWLSGDDGWTDSQRKAMLRHEYGHNIVAVPIIFLETLVFYWFYNNLSVWNTLLLIPAFISVWTLVNWLDELLADTFAGHHGFSLFSSIFKDASFLDYVLGGVGAYSHPPFLLRGLAFSYAIPIGVGIAASLGLLYNFTPF
jgi:hypothetical protein